MAKGRGIRHIDDQRGGRGCHGSFDYIGTNFCEQRSNDKIMNVVVLVAVHSSKECYETPNALLLLYETNAAEFKRERLRIYEHEF